MGVSVCCLGKDFKETFEFPQTLSSKSNGSHEDDTLYEPYEKPSDTNAGKLQMQVVCSVGGHKDGKVLSALFAQESMIWAQGSDNNGKVTIQTTIPAVNKDLPYANKYQDTSLDIRVNVRCIVDKFRDNTFQLQRMVMEQASFSCMIHN